MMLAYALHDFYRVDCDIARAVKILAVHDLAEAVTGDIDYRDIVEGKASKSDKAKLEDAAMQRLTSGIGAFGKEVYALFREYEEQKTKEARFARACDKLEAVSHLIKLGWEVFDAPQIVTFYANDAVRAVPELVPFLRELKKDLKEEFKRGDIPWKPEYDDI
jgi:putative hydrolase of HD superfamily